MAARKGEGTKYFDEKKQLWRAMLTTPAGKRITKASKHEEVVNDWMNEQRLLIGRNLHIEPHTVTLSEWIAEYLEVYVKKTIKPRTLDRYISLLAHASPIGDIQLRKLNASDIQKVYNQMLSKGLSTQTVSHFHTCLKSCLKHAVLHDFMYKNPAEILKPPKVIKKEIEIFTEEEIKKLFAAAQNHRHPVVLKIGYTTGMRMSEALALRWEDVDTKNKTLTVAKTVHTSASKGIYTSDTKNTSSFRTIGVPDEVIKDILAHKLKYGINEGPLFLNKNGGIEYGHHYIQKIYNRIQKDTGIKKGYHCFRHTHASELLAKGVPIVDVSRRLGHAKVSTTLNIYSHCMPSADKDAVRVVKRLLKGKENA